MNEQIKKIYIPVKNNMFITLVMKKGNDDLWTCTMNEECLNDIINLFDNYGVEKC